MQGKAGVSSVLFSNARRIAAFISSSLSPRLTTYSTAPSSFGSRFSRSMASGKEEQRINSDAAVRTMDSSSRKSEAARSP
jgi:hypothetical protein